MRIAITVRPGTARLLPDAVVRRCLRRAFRAAGAPAASAVTVIFSGDAELAALNEVHLGQPGPTDVLSFPLVPVGVFPPHPGQDPALRRVDVAAADFRLPPGEPVHLGDIVVSVERAISQARSGRGGQAGDRSWAPEDELRLLLVHGALHLCGWDHAVPEEAAAMRALETRLLGIG
jgi:probable rRNA maturation factor